LSLFSAEEPSLQTVTLEQLEVAFAEELADYLRQGWPEASLSDDSPRSKEFRRIWALEEVTLLVRAAARLGCTIHLIPLPKPGTHASMSGEQASRPGKTRRRQTKK
jgi:hypothetical protein